jgi:hypothetical protein
MDHQIRPHFIYAEIFPSSQYPQPFDGSGPIPFLRCNIQLYLHHHPCSYDLDRHGSIHDLLSRRRILLYLQRDLPYGHMSLARSESHFLR